MYLLLCRRFYCPIFNLLYILTAKLLVNVINIYVVLSLIRLCLVSSASEVILLGCLNSTNMLYIT